MAGGFIKNQLKSAGNKIAQRLIKKTVNSLWSKFDEAGIGAITKDKVEELLTTGLEMIGKSDLFDERRFNKIWAKIDEDQDGALEKEEVIKLCTELVIKAEAAAGLA